MKPERARIEGVRPLIEALRAQRRRVHEVWLPDHLSTPGLRELADLVRWAGVPVHRASSAAEVAAAAEPIEELPFESLLADPSIGRVVALDRVTDAGNLGSIARSALGAGFQALLLEHRHAAALGPGALRASAGALEHLRVARAPSLGRALALARGEGFRTLIADAAGPPLASVPAALLRSRILWVFGSEDRGVRREVREAGDLRVGIPMEGPIGSLGVSAAAAYLLHRTAEVLRSGAGVAEPAGIP